MKRDLLPQMAFGAVILVLILAGLAITGGPWQAQAERRDDRRLADLASLADFVRCRAMLAENVTPPDLAPEPSCASEVALQDPFTGKPYGYERVDDRSFRVCTTLETPLAGRGGYVYQGSFDEKTGCLTVRLDN